MASTANNVSFDFAHKCRGTRRSHLIAPAPPAGDYPLDAPGWDANFRHRTLKEMAEISIGHYGIFRWSVNSTMLDSAFLTNGMGAAFMRRFQQSEYDQALARIENMPYETMATSNR